MIIPKNSTSHLERGLIQKRTKPKPDSFSRILPIDEGERGDLNPRMAAPQAAALTTWRRPPWHL